jgi:hypothetical protein
MASLVLTGDTSGQVTIAAPAVAGTNTLTLQAATATSSVNTRESAVTCAGQTSIDFSSLPSWIKKITILFNGVSTSGTSNFLIQIGDSGGFEITGYVSGSFDNSTSSNSTIGFIASSQQIATATWGGAITISNLSGNVWVSSGTIASGTAGYLASSGGAKTLTDVLDRVRITTVNGIDTFDTTPSAGTINILYEG